MAKAPPPKQNFMQTMLIMVIVMMGVQLWTLNHQTPTNPIPPDKLYRALLDDNASRRDVTAVRDKQAYDSAIDDLVKARKLNQAEGDEKKIESAILVADTQFKAGVHSKDPGRMRDAYNTLQPYVKQYVDSPLWQKPVAVTDVTNDPVYSPGWREWSGDKLYHTIVDRLTESNRNDLVWGFIPGYQIMDGLVHVTGAIPSFSYAFAGFLLAFVVRAIVFPLSQKQLMFSRQMSQLSPMIKEIKDQFPDDPAEQQKRTMNVYKEYGINPFSGCWPAFVQLPLFLSVYQCMLRYQFQFQKGTFLWINQATSSTSHGFIAPNLGQTDYILIIIYSITMMSSTLLTPASDPSQVKQQRIMSVGITLMFTFFMFTGRFPVVSGFVLYWVFTNILSTAQSLRAYRLPLPPLVKVNAPGGGTYPSGGKGGGSKWMQMIERAQQMQQENASNPPSASNKWLNNDAIEDKKDSDDKGDGGTGRPVTHKPKKRK